MNEVEISLQNNFLTFPFRDVVQFDYGGWNKPL